MAMVSFGEENSIDVISSVIPYEEDGVTIAAEISNKESEQISNFEKTNLLEYSIHSKDDFKEKYPLLENTVTLKDISSPLKLGIAANIPENMHSAATINNTTIREEVAEINWVKAVQKSPEKKMSLKHIPISGGVLSPYKIPEEVGKLGDPLWNNSMVGYFLENKFPLDIISDIAKKIWAKYGYEDTIPCGNGFYLFNFSNPQGIEKVLELGPWHFFNRPIFIKKWSNEMSFRKEEFTNVPIWVKLSNIPLRYWTELGLSHIASLSGVPICVDDMTAKRKRLTFARILIEINIESEFPKELKFVGDNGIPFEIKVDYSWVPKMCENCKLFGHTRVTCTKEKREIKPKWIPKKQVAVMEEKSNLEEQNDDAKDIEEAWTEVSGKRSSSPKRTMGTWLAFGDFNAVRFHSEREGGNLRGYRSCDELNDCMFIMRLRVKARGVEF